MVVCNEDGRESRLPSNRLGLVGVFVVVVRNDGEGYLSLTETDVTQVRTLLLRSPWSRRTNGIGRAGGTAQRRHWLRLARDRASEVPLAGRTLARPSG